MVFSTSPVSGVTIKSADDHDLLGVIGALELICDLESRLRQAIQHTHPLTTSLDWDFQAADRERGALLSISQQLEYLEDKLRELRFVSPDDAEQKSILLGQLETVRRELIEIAGNSMDKVVYAKELVRDIMSFALAGDDGTAAEISPRLTSTPFRHRSSPLRTPKGKRTPSVPETLEIPSALRKERGETSSDYHSSGRNQFKERLGDQEPRSSQRKYANYSRTLMVSDEDIYGPKDSSTPTTVSQNYGGTVKVKELLAKAEKGLSGVVAAQNERRNAPKVVNTEDTAMGEESAWIAPESEESSPTLLSPVEDRHPGTKSSARRKQSGPERTASISTSRYSKYDVKTLKRNITSNFDGHSERNGNGLAGVISKLAGLTVALGGATAAIIALSVTLGGESKTKSRKRHGKRHSLHFRGEADVPASAVADSNSYDELSFEETFSSNEIPDQYPVMNVHRLPTSRNFPSSTPPEVTAAMG